MSSWRPVGEPVCTLNVGICQNSTTGPNGNEMKSQTMKRVLVRPLIAFGKAAVLNQPPVSFFYTVVPLAQRIATETDLTNVLS